MRLVAIIVLGLADAAHADLAERMFERSNAGRHELGLGLADGALAKYELHAGHHPTDRWMIAGRTRVGDDLHVAELDLSYVLGRGQMVLPGDHVLRVDLAFSAGGGMAWRDGVRAPVMFGGAAVRVQPRSLNALSIELGVRHAAEPEMTLRLALVFPFDQYECWAP